MKIIKQLFWILLFSLLGELSSIILADFIVIPGSVLGLLMLFLALHFNFLELSAVDKVGSWLTDNMAIFFVPAGVGLMTNFNLLTDSWFFLLVIMFISSASMMGVVGLIVQSITEDSKDTKNPTIKKGSDKK